MKEHSNLRRLPQLTHEGRTVIADGRHMLNLSSNDYLGLAADRQLKEEFLQTLTPDTFLPTSSSSRLLTGNFGIYEEHDVFSRVSGAPLLATRQYEADSTGTENGRLH